MEIVDHLLDHRHLLRVLLAENGDVGPHNVEQLGDNGGDPPEMGRPRDTAEGLRDQFLGDIGRIALGIHLVDRRREDDVGARLLTQVEVARQVARIVRIVLARAELRGIDEDRHDHRVGSFLGEPDEAEVPLMQRAHRRHESDQPVLGPQIHRGGLHVEDGGDHLHGRKGARRSGGGAEKTGLELSRCRQL